jgi:cobalt/nickel transport system permease protein
MAGMFDPAMLFLPAVHISDGLLDGRWLLGGFLVAGIFALMGCWRLTEEEIPRVALLTAAFFVASSLHLPLGPSSVHLLLNGLVGVILGWRAALAIPVGVFMQAVLLHHGGYSTIGINSVIELIPALLAGQLFAALRRIPGIYRPGPRAGLVGISVLCVTLGLVFSVVLLWECRQPDAAIEEAAASAWEFTSRPLVLLPAGLIAAASIWVESRMQNSPEFPLGLLVGELTVFLTVALQTVVLIVGGAQDFRTFALIELIAHVPVAVIEGVVLGFMVGYLARVKPEMLGCKTVEAPACPVESLP